MQNGVLHPISSNLKFHKKANEILGIKDDGSMAHQLSTLLTELDFDM